MTQALTASDDAILVGLGANLPSRFGPPERTLRAALERLPRLGVGISACSRLWRSAPLPAADQPWYVNAVAAIATSLDPEALLALLHRLEADFGRVRAERNAPRLLDLDLLAYGRQIRTDSAPILPHPRLTDRAFVLLPLAEILPDWRHPLRGKCVADLIAGLPPNQSIEPLA